MLKKYVYIALLLTCLFPLGTIAQESKSTAAAGKEPVEGLTIYPNPAKADRVYITTSKPSLTKEIEIYDMFGNRIVKAVLTAGSKEINISALNRGIYLITVKEGDAFSTRKLIVE